MRRTLLEAARALFMALMWSPASSAAAQRARTAEWQVDWTAPPECSSARNLRERVMSLSGAAPDPRFKATIHVTRTSDGYRAQAVLSGPSGSGTRQLEDARCEILVDKLAVLMALSIPSAAPPDAGRSPSWALRPETQVASGSLPLTTAGLGAAVAVDGLGPLRIELHGSYYFPQSRTFEGTTLGGQFKLLTAGGCICRVWSFEILEWGPCVGAEVHHVSASGFGGAIQRPGSTVWWGPALRLFARAQLLPVFGISVAVEGVVPMSRPQFVFSDVGVLHRVGALTLQASVGPEVRF
jgi:hypothetical protein